MQRMKSGFMIAKVIIVFMLAFVLVGCDPPFVPDCSVEFRVMNNSGRLLEVVIVWDNEDIKEILFRNGTTVVFRNHLCDCKMEDPNDYINSVTILDADEKVIKIFDQHDETGKLLGLSWNRSDRRFTLNITSALLD